MKTNTAAPPPSARGQRAFQGLWASGPGERVGAVGERVVGERVGEAGVLGRALSGPTSRCCRSGLAMKPRRAPSVPRSFGLSHDQPEHSFSVSPEVGVLTRATLTYPQ